MFEGVLALGEFHSASEASVAVFGQDAEHVAVKIVFAAGFQARDAEAKGDHAATVEGAEHLAADFVGDDEQAEREKFEVVKTPDFLLEADDFGEFFVCAELMNRDCGVHRKGRCAAERRQRSLSL